MGSLTNHARIVCSTVAPAKTIPYRDCPTRGHHHRVKKMELARWPVLCFIALHTHATQNGKQQEGKIAHIYLHIEHAKLICGVLGIVVIV